MKRLGVLLMVLLCFSVTAEAKGVQAENIQAVTQASVHAGATKDYRIVGKVGKGNAYAYLDRFTNKQGETWFRVAYKKGAFGWVHSSAFGAIDIKKVVERSTVHSGALPSYRQVGTLNPSDQVLVIDTFTHLNSEKWYRIRLDSKTLGWVKETAFGEVSGLPTKAVSNQSVYSGALPTYRHVGTAEKDKTYSIIGHHTHGNGDIWYRIRLNDKTMGWVPEETFLAMKKRLSAKATMSIHSGALKTYRQVGATKPGQNYPVVDTFTHASGEVWYRIRVTKDVLGWVPSSAFLETKSEPLGHFQEQLDAFLYDVIGVDKKRHHVTIHVKVLTQGRAMTDVMYSDFGQTMQKLVKEHNSGVTEVTVMLYVDGEEPSYVIDETHLHDMNK